MSYPYLSAMALTALLVMAGTPTVRSEAEGTLWADFLDRSEAETDHARFAPYLLELDVEETKDGLLLLSHTLTCGNAQCAWYGYEKVSSGQYRYVGELFFHPVGLRWNAQQRELVAYYRHGGREGHFETYRLTESAFVQVGGSSAALDRDSPEAVEELGKIADWQKTGPAVWTCKWSSVRWGQDDWWDYSRSRSPGPGAVTTTGLFTRLSQARLEASDQKGGQARDRVAQQPARRGEHPRSLPGRGQHSMSAGPPCLTRGLHG